MKPLLFAGALTAALLFQSACATRPTAKLDTAQIEPFVLERDLVGKTIGQGQFSAINGTKRGFTAYLDGSWDGDTLTLVEDFEYDDGETDRKTWRLTQQPDGTFIGTREDVVGTAKGFMDGDSFRLEYDVKLASDDGDGMQVRFRDILTKRSDGVILNRATVGKFGLRVATVNLEIRPADDQ